MLWKQRSVTQSKFSLSTWPPEAPQPAASPVSGQKFHYLPPTESISLAPPRFATSFYQILQLLCTCTYMGIIFTHILLIVSYTCVFERNLAPYPPWTMPLPSSQETHVNYLVCSLHALLCVHAVRDRCAHAHSWEGAVPLRLTHRTRYTRWSASSFPMG